MFKINMGDLETAFDYHGDADELTYFLDLELGEVVMSTREQRDLLDEVYQDYADPETGKIDWPSVLPRLDDMGWEVEPLPGEDLIRLDVEHTRFLVVPQTPSHEGYEDMVGFIKTVANPRLQIRLEKAIEQRSPFRLFKEALLGDERERQRWFVYRDESLRRRITAWLEAEGIELI
jgi:hypothetical protein